MKGYAKFSDDRHYRYVLGRIWSTEELPTTLTWVMINPSTADASRNDPTIRRCIEFSKREGYGGLFVVNLFAKRSSDPSVLKNWPDPVGPDNDKWIQWGIRRSPSLVLAWGNNGRKWPERIKEVMSLIKSHTAYCLGLTNSGQPKHPLMLPAKTKMVRYAHH